MKLIYCALLCFSANVFAAKFAQGDISPDTLFAHYEKFNQAYHAYTPAKADIEKLSRLPELELAVYFGSWCHDSQREVPRWLKSLAMANNPKIKVSLIALDLSKTEPQGRAVAAGVKYTPTLVIRQNNVELGRIVEKSEGTLAEEIERLMISRL